MKTNRKQEEKKMNDNETTEKLFDSVVKSIVSIENDLIQAVAYSVISGSSTSYKPDVKLIVAVHKHVAENVVKAISENADAWGQYGEFLRCLEDYENYKHFINITSKQTTGEHND
tara:strand:- start:2189 stop:2533 length:345 start_codon:yes stop_codon:yes gene_type:complete